MVLATTEDLRLITKPQVRHTGSSLIVASRGRIINIVVVIIIIVIIIIIIIISSSSIIVIIIINIIIIIIIIIIMVSAYQAIKIKIYFIKHKSFIECIS